MNDRKMRGKAIYLLLWLMIVCGGILVRAGTRDSTWQMVYDGIYMKPENASRSIQGGASSPERDVYRYISYWQLRVREECSSYEGAKDSTENADNGERGSTEEVSGVKSTAAVTAMADISSSYIGMDAETLFSYCFNSPVPACITDEELDAEELLGKDMSIDRSGSGYKVLIYHTHSSETFADSREGVTEDTIVGVGERLAEVLTDTYGIPVLHDTGTYDMMSGKLDRDAAYEYSRAGVLELLEEYPDIEVIIDLHRDGVADGVHLVTEVDGKQTAQVMIVNGMSRNGDGEEVEYLPNPYRKDNLALSLQTYLAGRANYGDMVRKIYLSSYRYNLHLIPKSMLIEVGAQTNTLEEEMNAVEPLAAMLAKVLLE